MHKVEVLIAAHCVPKVLKLTLGSWLRAYNGEYEAHVHVGLHENYDHYHKPGPGEIEALCPAITVHKVKEVPWNTHGVMRYSAMHAMSVQNMMKAIIDRDFTHVAILDHDVLAQGDFIEWMLANHAEAEVVTGLFEDRDYRRLVKMNIGPSVYFAPKPTIYHMMINRRMFDRVMEQPEMVLAHIREGIAYETFALPVDLARYEWDMDVRIVPVATLAELAQHLSASSFNFGSRQRGDEGLRQHIAGIEQMYDEMFPAGIDHLLEKLDHG